MWWSSSTVVGERFTVKFAWSRPAALRLAHEISVLTALGREPRVPFLPEVVASSTDPVLLITRLMPRGIAVRGHGTLRLVVDLETAGAAEPEYDLRLTGPDMGTGVQLLTAVMRHYQRLTGRCALHDARHRPRGTTPRWVVS